MASSRPLRKSSRRSSPADVSMTDCAREEEKTQTQKEKKAVSEGWNEPPLRTPAPSFADYKGLERHGVLEHMAPLGSLPNQKVKLRLKNHDPPRRLTQTKLGETMAAKDVVSVPDPISAGIRRSEPRKVEDRVFKASSSREREEDQDYTPKSVPKPTSAKTLQLHISPQTIVPPQISAAQARLRQVVDSAVDRSYEIGNPILGLAVRQLFEESLNNHMLADLLEAVLSQRPTPRQAADFQGYIRVARKQIKAEKGLNRHSSMGINSLSKSTSKSPSKTARPSVASQVGTHSDRAHATDTINKTLNSKQQPNGEVMETNGSPAKEERPAKRRKRSKSASSSSSLSSLSSIDLETTPKIRVRTPPTTNSKPLATAGPKLHSFSTTNLPMPSQKRSSVTAGLMNGGATENQAAERRKLQKTFDDYTVNDSNLRVAPTPKESDATLPAISQGPTRLPSRPQPTRLRNGTHRQGRRDDYEDLQSPASSVPGELLVPVPPEALHSPRGGTPNQLGRPPKLVKKAARVKISPMKKRTGVIAGIARSGGGRDSPVGYGHTDDNEDHDNVDYCSACSGSGQLLCCDGCTRSFHFTCLDPPMNANKPPEGEWYCYICESKRDPQPKPPRGVFAALLAALEKKNPTAYVLPLDIRDYFEGVRTGEEGEYEDTVALRSKTRAGYVEAPDTFQLKDAKDNFVSCYHCGKSSLGHREIIACDFCNLKWHLDCLDPPLANPPPRGNGGRPRHSWMCPNHVDPELQGLDSTSRSSTMVQSNNCRTFKVRRPRRARIVDTNLRRGFTNNGLIEIENELLSDEELESTRRESGVVYRLPERGIKLDFIDRVKRSWLEPSPEMQKKAQLSKLIVREREERRARIAAAAKAQNGNKEAFDKRPFIEQRTAFNLAQFAQSNTDLNLSTDQVENLIGTLIAEAPAEVVALCTQEGVDGGDRAVSQDPSVPPTPPESDKPGYGLTEQEKQTLVMVQELIRRRLGGPAL